MAVVNRETDYALRLLTRLVGADRPMSVTVLAELEEVPQSFARKILQRLQRAGIVKSVRGPFGGYRLAKPPGGVSVLDVVEAAQGPIVMNECLIALGICRRARACPIREHLRELQAELNARLDRVRLTDVAEAIQRPEEALKRKPHTRSKRRKESR